MIGVTATNAHRDCVSEFFQLFKTPWEWVVPGKRYDVVLCADGETEPSNAKLAVVYGAAEHPMDRRAGVSTRRMTGPVAIQWRDFVLPVYRGLTTFQGGIDRSMLSTQNGAADYCTADGARTFRRVGYDLFSEVSHLLSEGQPSSYARNPTLETHIALIRQILADAGVEYVEVPPRPHGADFICCLTHDVDFFGIRRHVADRTLAGFAVRGTLGTVWDVIRGQRPLDEAVRNLRAVASLPLVLAGARPDPWDPFRDYARADRGHKSTFFLVPFKSRPGTAPDGTVAAARAVAYCVRDVQAQVQEAVASEATEVAVHGIDAWRDADAGRAEKAEVNAVTGQQRTGVRMHWLYFSADSPRYLEDAGFDYDSTCGYNDTVGFRAGTLQAFGLPGTRHLLELPLSIMDSAMFYPDRMGLTRDEAAKRCTHLVQQAQRFGGALVINWHDRSLAPERQWGRFYNNLLDDVEAAGAWFATAADAIEWFRWRRSIRFSADPNSQTVTVAGDAAPRGLPHARVTVQRRGGADEVAFAGETCRLTL